jgi:hypothetical protein
MMALGKIPSRLAISEKQNKRQEWKQMCTMDAPLIPHQCYLPAGQPIVVLQFQALGSNHVHF